MRHRLLPRSPYDESDPDLLQNRPVLDRFIVTSAGIVANIMFAYAVLFGQALNIGVVDPVFLPGENRARSEGSRPNHGAVRSALQTSDALAVWCLGQGSQDCTRRHVCLS